MASKQSFCNNRRTRDQTRAAARRVGQPGPLAQPAGLAPSHRAAKKGARTKKPQYLCGGLRLSLQRSSGDQTRSFMRKDGRSITEGVEACQPEVPSQHHDVTSPAWARNNRRFRIPRFRFASGRFRRVFAHGAQVAKQISRHCGYFFSGALPRAALCAKIARRIASL